MVLWTVCPFFGSDELIQADEPDANLFEILGQ